LYPQQFVTQIIRNTPSTHQQPSPVQNQFQQIQPAIQQFNNKQIIPIISILSSTPSSSSSVQASNSSNNQTENNHIINKNVIRIDNKDRDPIGDVTTMAGIDTEAEKKSLLGVTTKWANLEQI
jgi:hypothetical protein